MKRTITIIAMAAAVVACTTSYRIHVVEHQNSNRPLYIPEERAKAKGYLIATWVQGTPVLEQNEAMNQIIEWKNNAAHIKRTKNPRYIKVK
jgi:hypothetical protein